MLDWTTKFETETSPQETQIIYIPHIRWISMFLRSVLSGEVLSGAHIRAVHVLCELRASSRSPKSGFQTLYN